MPSDRIPKVALLDDTNSPGSGRKKGRLKTCDLAEKGDERGGGDGSNVE